MAPQSDYDAGSSPDVAIAAAVAGDLLIACVFEIQADAKQGTWQVDDNLANNSFTTFGTLNSQAYAFSNYLNAQAFYKVAVGGETSINTTELMVGGAPAICGMFFANMGQFTLTGTQALENHKPTSGGGDWYGSFVDFVYDADFDDITPASSAIVMMAYFGSPTNGGGSLTSFTTTTALSTDDTTHAANFGTATINQLTGIFNPTRAVAACNVLWAPSAATYAANKFTVTETDVGGGAPGREGRAMMLVFEGSYAGATPPDTYDTPSGGFLFKRRRTTARALPYDVNTTMIRRA